MFCVCKVLYILGAFAVCEVARGGGGIGWCSSFAILLNRRCHFYNKSNSNAFCLFAFPQSKACQKRRQKPLLESILSVVAHARRTPLHGWVANNLYLIPLYTVRGLPRALTGLDRHLFIVAYFVYLVAGILAYPYSRPGAVTAVPGYQMSIPCRSALKSSGWHFIWPKRVIQKTVCSKHYPLKCVQAGFHKMFKL
jgi:hypothetical protein